MWKLLAQSCKGTSHRRGGAPCQDAHLCSAFDVARGTVLVIACADGAGSAEFSDVGANIACDRFFELAHEALRHDGAAVIERETVLGWYRAVGDEIRGEANQRDVPARQLACTLLTAIIREHDAVFAQIGDGSIVYREAEHYEPVFWPQTGEYANVTNFVTQDELEAAFDFEVRRQRIDELAMFTDGLQRLALDFANQRVHQPFFAPLFAPLRAAEFADELAVPLLAFLDSPAVNERTDDDKTLVLATRFAADDSGAGAR